MRDARMCASGEAMDRLQPEEHIVLYCMFGCAKQWLGRTNTLYFIACSFVIDCMFINVIYLISDLRMTRPIYCHVFPTTFMLWVTFFPVPECVVAWCWNFKNRPHRCPRNSVVGFCATFRLGRGRLNCVRGQIFSAPIVATLKYVKS
jgi:hypothetical protein